MADTVRASAEAADESLIGNLIQEIIQSPLNLLLVGIIAFLVYKIIKSRQTVHIPEPPVPELPKLRRDFTLEELKKYDGHNEDGRILIAVNGNVYDVTKGKKFYGLGKCDSHAYAHRVHSILDSHYQSSENCYLKTHTFT